MPKTHTPDGNYAQNISYRDTARAAAHEKQIEAKAKKPLGPRPYRRIDPNCLKRGKWDETKLKRAPSPVTGKNYPYASERQRWQRGVR